MDRSLEDVVATLQAGEDAHLYTTLAPLYRFIYDRHFDYDEQAAVVRAAAPAGATSVLEVGCGHGRLLARLAEAFDEAVGVDNSEAMVALARETAPGAEVLAADGRVLDLGRRFDVVVALGRVLPHATTDEDAVALLTSCRRHLEPGGVLVCNTFDRRGIEDGHRSEATFTSSRWTVTRTSKSTVEDAATGEWRFTAEYAITDRATGETTTAQETMQLRAHDPADLEHYLGAAGLVDPTFVRETPFSLRVVARRPDG